MTDHPMVTRDTPMSVVAPVIPLHLLYPGLSLAQVLAIVWAWRRTAIAIALGVLTVTALALLLWPRTYTAKVTLMVNYEVNDPLNGKELPVGQLGSYIATQIELMQTPEVLLAVVDRLDLTHDEEYASGFRGVGGTLRDWVAAKLRKTLAIYQGQMGSQLIYVMYTANDPVEAARIANTVAEVYTAQDYTRSTGPPVERARRYAEQLAGLKAKVDQAQKEVTAFHQRNGLIEEGNKADVDVVLLATLEGRLLEAQNARRAAEARAYGDQSVSDQVLASPEVQSLKTQLAQQELRLAQLNLAYTPQFPAVIEMQSSIGATRRSLAAALTSYSANASAGLGAARRLQRNLQQAVADQRVKVLAAGQLHDNAAKYLLALESARTVYRRALEGYDQIMFASGGQYTNTSLVSHATPPVRASTPKVLTGIALGGMAALLLGLGIPLGYEFLNRRVRCRDDLERHHAIPVLVEFGRSFALAAA
jgi:uncharacterized protein involved in exopolysaccharide biosynthesis